MCEMCNMLQELLLNQYFVSTVYTNKHKKKITDVSSVLKTFYIISSDFDSR